MTCDPQDFRRHSSIAACRLRPSAQQHPKLLACSNAEAMKSTALSADDDWFEREFAASAQRCVRGEQLLVQPVNADAEIFFEMRTDIRGMLALNCEAGLVWAELLVEGFPEFKGLSCEVMLLHTVAHSLAHRLPQRSGQLDFIEYWAGSASLTKEHVRLGARCARFDKVYDQGHDCSTPEGLRRWLESLNHVVESGSVWCGTQCSSFLLMCMSKSRRRPENGYHGDMSRAFVKEGNRHMKVLSLLYFVAWLLRVDVVLEQPTESVSPLIQPLKCVLQFVGAVRTHTWLGHKDFGGPSPKPIQLWHTSSKYAALKRKRPCSKPTLQLVTKLKGKRFRGDPKLLKASQVYPPGFALAAAIANVAATQVVTPPARDASPCRRRKRHNARRRSSV